jgi:hypothetical protein
MRRAIVALAMAAAAGCGDGAVHTPPSADAAGNAAPAERRGKLESVTRLETEADSGPARFDAASAGRTLRWIGGLTEPFRRPTPTRVRPVDQWKAAQDALAEAMRQTVKWKVPVQAVGGDGSILFSPVRTANFPDRSDKHPEITLRIRAWNATQLDSPFACPVQPWQSSLRPGQDSITVTGQVAGINTGDLYNWSVALYAVQLTPDADQAPPPAPESQPADGFAPNDPDKAFAWMRQQVYPTLDPFETPAERERRKKEVTARFRSLAGTTVRWRWPTAVANDFAVTPQDLVFPDYPRQLGVAMTLWFKQRKKSAASGQSEYMKALVGSPKDPVVNPELTAKVRASKKSTVSGKVAKVLFAEGGTYPPRVLEIAVRLDDVVVEP